ncbi:Ano1 [Symbiodinium necroappetens]|uniref:Ano1 protein n=1 Tax=Symbiodinium necroappetens TaxID=1628268 RepID=A0A813C1X6_9DINO|nr:Ano1 [Symbiodinium necroappetens]
MLDNSQRWQYVFAFPMDFKSDHWSSPAFEPNEAWDRIFTRLDGTAEMTFSTGTTNKQFHQAVLDELVKILTGPWCGFEVGKYRTIDEDELFLLVSLEDEEAIKAIAEKEEFPAMLRHDVVYKDLTCATDESTGRDRFRVRDFGEFLDGKRHTNRYPGHVRYSAEVDEVCEDFYTADHIRLARHRIRRFVRLQSLVSEGVVNQYFCVHHWTDLQFFYQVQRWNDPCNLLQWPAEHLPDSIQQYFGADLSFFFHWFNAYTSRLLVATLGVRPCNQLEAVFILAGSAVHADPGSGKVSDLREFFPAIYTARSSRRFAGESSLDDRYVAFSIFLGVWSTTFLARYKHMKNLKVLKWGMKHHDREFAEIRRQFRDDYRDSWGEYFQQLLHWILCVAFMAETVFFTLFVSQLRIQARVDPMGRSYGIRHQHLQAYGKYMITANIKIVDYLWTNLSTYLSKNENWRTPGELRNKATEKLFAVKFVVYYYPFLYTIFIKPAIYDIDIQPCFKALSSDLRLFFFTQIVMEVIFLFVSLLTSWLKVASERRRFANKEYSYLEYQAKCPEYSDEDLMSDVQLQVINYGFLVMFGVCLPYVCCICFCVNFLFKRILAYKVSYIYQRPSPFGAEGFGAEDIITLLSWIGVIFNTFLVIFVSPLCGDMSLHPSSSSSGILSKL